MRTKRAKCVQIFLVLLTIAALGGAAASAQTAQAPQAPKPKYQTVTDAAVSFYRDFNTATAGNNTKQVPSDSFGVMGELRQIQSPWIGYEITYAFNKGNQYYEPNPGKCGFLCGNPKETITAGANLVSMDWVPTHRLSSSVTAFGVAGMGFYIDVPIAQLGNLQTVVRPMWVYGGGIDWAFHPHMGLRLQYRGNFYKAPDLDNNYNATGSFAESYMPMIGFYFPL